MSTEIDRATFISSGRPSTQYTTKRAVKPIFNKMMEAPDNIVPHEITEEYVLSSYTRGTLFLKENYSYIFTRSSDVLSKYTIGTWSKKIKPSEVRKNGTEQDKQRLSEPTAYNKKRKQKDRTQPTVRSDRRFINKVTTKVVHRKVQQQPQESEVV